MAVFQNLILKQLFYSQPAIVINGKMIYLRYTSSESMIKDLNLQKKIEC